MKFLPLLLAHINDRARNRLTGLTTTARALAVVGVLASISLFFFLTALTIVLAEQIGVVMACLVMGGIFAVLAAVMYMQYTRKRRRKEIEKIEQVAIASSADTPLGAGFGLLAQAFVRGFLNRRSD